MRLQPDQFWGYFEWLFLHGGLLTGFLLAVALSLVGFVISYLVALARSGPVEGFYTVSKTISSLIRVDLPGTSLRRIGAIAKLAFKEAIRRKVLAVVAIFIVLLMFAGWFLNPQAADPAKLYISFVLTATNYMVLLLGLFISAFSLPNEIKSRTIYTIVTKPVRPTEISSVEWSDLEPSGRWFCWCLGCSATSSSSGVFATTTSLQVRRPMDRPVKRPLMPTISTRSS